MIRALSDLVPAQAERRPRAIALVTEGARLTYEDVALLSRRLATALREAGCREGSRVGLLLPKSPWAILSMLAVLEAGGIYVPVDIKSPAARVARILASCEPAVLLASGPAEGLVRELARTPAAASVPLGWLDHGGAPLLPAFDLEHVLSCPATGGGARADSHAPAHILFTSGSTGQPKGVPVTHHSVLRFIEWAAAHFGMGPGDRVSGHSPLYFDLSTFDVYGAFAAGAELHPVPPELSLLPHRLADFIRERGLTQWFSVPAVLGYLARYGAVEEGDFPLLRRVLWCGEVLPTPVLVHWMRRLPHVRFTNLYGPTETTIASSFHDVPCCPEDERATIPIGRPCDGESLMVLDERQSPVPPGEVGQIHIAGEGLSPGYWRDPARTAEAFVVRAGEGGAPQRVYRTGDLGRVDEEGLFHFVGRADTQVKVRGHRVELGEIEAALQTVRGVAEHAVVAVGTDGFEGSVLCCAFVSASGVEVTGARLRAELARLLPGYMLPSRWLSLAALPRNANGKIDRAALRERFVAGGTRGAAG